jgi:hypothetical protein
MRTYGLLIAEVHCALKWETTTRGSLRQGIDKRSGVFLLGVFFPPPLSVHIGTRHILGQQETQVISSVRQEIWTFSHEVHVPLEINGGIHHQEVMGHSTWVS